MKIKLFLPVFFAVQFFSAQYVRIIKDIIKYDKTDVAKISGDNNTIVVTSLDGKNSYEFVETAGKLVNKEKYFVYKITDLQTKKANNFILYNPVELLGRKSTFVQNFAERPFHIQPYAFISEYGFNSGKIENLINKSAVNAQEIIAKKNDSIKNKFDSVLKDFDDDKLSITFDNKIMKVVNGSKINIGTVERIDRGQGFMDYKVYLMIKEKLKYVGFFSTSGIFKTDFLSKESPKDEEVSLQDQLIINGDRIYKIPLEAVANLPLSKDPNAKKVVAFVYSTFKNQL